MTNIELKALRQVCFLTQAECAEHVSETSVRSWTNWENGSRAVPDDVSKAMRALVARRAEEIHNAYEFGSDSGFCLDWYTTYDSFRSSGGSYTDWRISQSVAAYYLAEYKTTLKIIV